MNEKIVFYGYKKYNIFCEFFKPAFVVSSILYNFEFVPLTNV